MSTITVSTSARTAAMSRPAAVGHTTAGRAERPQPPTDDEHERPSVGSVLAGAASFIVLMGLPALMAAGVGLAIMGVIDWFTG